MVNVSVILPCKNEEKNITDTLDRLKAQTIQPKEVVIVDDASTDNTLRILQEITNRYGWILKRREKNDERYISIVNALKLASSLLKQNFDYLMILDGDTLLEQQYIEKIIKKFELIPNLGIAGGSLKSPDDSKMASFLKYSYNVFGSNRIYSKKCWFDINDGTSMQANSVTWDTEHSVLAEVKGYIVKRFDDITSESIRVTSNKLPSFIRGAVYYQFGYSLPFTVIHSIYKLKINYLLGYLNAWMNKKKRIGDQRLLNQIRKQHDQRAFKRISEISFKS